MCARRVLAAILPWVILSFTIAMLPARPAAAQVTSTVATPDRAPRGWWGEVRLGVGALDSQAQVPGGSGSSTGLVLDLAGGIRVGEHWLYGLDLGGITLEAYDFYGTEGESLDHIFALAQYHPRLDSGPFFHAAAGWVSHTQTSFGWYLQEGDGWGGELGVGYSWHVTPRTHIDALLRYEYGHIDLDEAEFAGYSGYDYGAPKLTVNLSFR